MTGSERYEHDLHPLRIESTDESPRETLPQGRYPTVADPMVDSDLAASNRGSAPPKGSIAMLRHLSATGTAA